MRLRDGSGAGQCGLPGSLGGASASQCRGLPQGSNHPSVPEEQEDPSAVLALPEEPDGQLGMAWRNKRCCLEHFLGKFG